MRDVMRQAAALIAPNAHVTAPEALDPDLVERWAAGIAAALETLPPAVRRVWEFAFDELLHALDDVSADASVDTSMGHGVKPA